MEKKIRKIIIILCFGMLISCSSVGKRVVPDSAVVSRDTVVSNSIEEVKKKFNEAVEAQHVGLFRSILSGNCFRRWKNCFKRKT